MMCAQPQDTPASPEERIQALEKGMILLNKLLLERMPALYVDRLEFPVHERVLTAKDTQTDLGLILGPLIAEHRRVRVSFDLSGLVGDLRFEWNEPIVVPDYHELSISGPFDNDPAEAQLPVQIAMTRNQTVDRPSHFTNRRNPGRAYVGAHAHLFLRGFRISESANDSRALAPSACEGGALFNISGDFGAVTLEQSYVSSTEDVVGFGSRVFGRVRFGHTHVSRQDGMVRTMQNPETKKQEVAPIYAVKWSTGWCFAGAGGVVSCSHTHLGAGVTFEQTPSILYLP